MAFMLQSSTIICSPLRKRILGNLFNKICCTSNKLKFQKHCTFRPCSTTVTKPRLDIGIQQHTENHSSLNLSIGDKLHGFQVKQIEDIPEFSLVAVKLVHEATEAEYLHIDKQDSNNAFSVLFRTTPMNSTGLPHILEHTTLCGSKMFPCRDPFFKMLNRSLSSFMNAMTAPDWTMYPFLTQNSQDFKNLMRVYLDAVFCPLLKETDFSQEGWRLEYVDPHDSTGEIIIKGVVFNEMKGVFSDNQNIFREALQNNMLPSHTYGVCSGGNPLEIPNLTYEDLKNFHNNYYSPFNAKYYSYGNKPISEHLKLINEYLTKVEMKGKGKLSTVVPPEKRWTEPVHKHITCRDNPLAADKNKQSSIAISQLCCSVTDIEERFILNILSELLLSGPNAVFYKTLIEPNIGSGFSPVTGFQSDTRDTFFTVGLQEVAAEDFKQITKIYEDTIDDVIKNGLDKDHLESILHSIELNSKHQTPKFGLSLLFNIVSTWNHDGDVFSLLKIENQIKNLRKKMANDNRYLEKKVKEYLKDNKHKLVLTMSPDPNFESDLKKKEENLLHEKLKELDDAKRLKIYEDGLKLLEDQKLDDKSCLPTLSVNDLNKEIEPEFHIDKEVSGIPFRLIPQPTNGVTYFRGILNVKNFSHEEISLLPLFAIIATKMGTKKHNYKDFHQLISLKTGGLNFATHVINDTKNLNKIEECLTISSYCLDKNLEDMFNLWLELFKEMELSDVNRFVTLLKSHAASLTNDIVGSGHSYAMLSSASLISPVAKRNEEQGGMTYVNLMKDLVQRSPEELLDKMRHIANVVTNQSQTRFSANVMGGMEDSVLAGASKFIENISASPGKINFESPSLPKVEYNGIFHILPIPVNFASKSVIGVPYEHDDFAPLRVMSRLLTMKFLHPEIREKAGAYGCGLVTSMSGTMSFFSYSDPNPSNSLNVFDKAASWLTERNFTQEDVDEAKLGVFQSVDAPVAPGDKGMRQFMYGISDETLSQHRLRLMNVSMNQIIEVGAKYLDETKNKHPVGRSVIGQENNSIRENSSCKWKVYQ